MLTWTQALSVGVKEIDDQHKYWFELFNELFSSFKNLSIKEDLGGILDRVISYTRSHFATEEKYFDQFNYPETKEHTQIHQWMLTKLEKFALQYNQGDLEIIEPTLSFFEDWLVDHIGIVDKKYSKFFNEHGLH